MRISTSQSFDRPLLAMQQLTAHANDVQTQISTGKKLLAPSSDAGAYIQLQSLQRSMSNDSAYATNMALAQGVLAQTDTALESIETQLQRVRELVTKAASDTNSDTDRAAIAAELDSLRDELFGIANATDVRGQPIFGGASGDAAYSKADDGTIRYSGEGMPGGIPIADGVTIQSGVSGPQVFAAGDSDIFAVLDTLSAALKSGGSTNGAANTALAGLTSTESQVSLARASVGARGVRLDLAADAMTETAAVREGSRSALEDTDVATAVTELQKTLTILQATQASFTKLSSLSLFDYI